MPKILKNKFYLYLTEFVSGIAVMAVELGASRLLAPYFSSSQIVWTIIIGTIMIAMALGNVYGGRTADKNPDPDRLYKRLVIAAIWIALIPVLGKFVILLISGLLFLTGASNFLVLAAFISSFAIFVFPLFLLGTVTPSLVKYTTDSLEDNGKIVGSLGAFNTIGSIIGTFMPTFVTIPTVGTAITFLIFSGLLLAVALVYFFSEKKQMILCFIAIAIFIVCGIFGNSDSFAFWEKNLKYEGESVYNYLQVKEDEQKTIFSTNVLFGVQSVKFKNEDLYKTGTGGMYYDYADDALTLAGLDETGEGDVLVLGNGTGTFQRIILTRYPNVNVEGVEIDKGIIDLSHEYFGLQEEAQVAEMDGRSYLQFSDKKYDVILCDAYQDITIPFQMSSIEFFDLVRQHLKDDGIMVVNMNMRTEDSDGINAYIADTIGHVFSDLYTVDVDGWTNRELFATNSAEMSAKIKNAEDYGLNSFTPYIPGDRLLTDDRAGVELLGMRAIDGIIERELQYYRDIFEKEGIDGLLQAL